jgi:hypothetical protein
MKSKKFLRVLLILVIHIVLLYIAVIGLLTKFNNDRYTHFQTVGVLDTVTAANLAETGFVPADTYERDWAIYVYLCGSDLESVGAAATLDLEEMFSVPLPSGVTYVIQTGGATKWYNNYADPASADRFVYDENGINRAFRSEAQNMGETETFEEFLRFCTANYPAKNMGVILWDHGSGPLGGVCSDENFGGDTLKLDEMGDALGGVFDRNSGSPALSFIGFDACLMATVEVAQTVEGYAEYLIASEEVEGGFGWNYAAISNALSENPEISPKDLGIKVLDGFYETAVETEKDELATLALVDLKKLPSLSKSLDDFVMDLLTKAQADPSVIARMKRGAVTAEQYGTDGGINSYTDFFWNMADMGDLITNIAAETNTEPDALLAALNEAVVRNIHGETNENSSGLSMFFPYDAALGMQDSYIRAYVKIPGISQPLCYLYEYAVAGYISDDGIAYMNDFGSDISGETSKLLTIGDLSLDEWAVFTEGDNAVMEIGPDIAANLSDVSLYNFGIQYEANGDITLSYLGTGTRTEKDWENGVFTSTFDGMWVSLDGQPIYAECTYEGISYSLFSTPVIYEGEHSILRFSKDNKTGEYRILGLINAETVNNIADRDLTVLSSGDRITPVSYVMSYEALMTLDDDTEDQVFFDSFEEQRGNDIRISDTSLIKEIMLPDGGYIEFFMMKDAMGREAVSSFAYREIENGVPLEWETE